MRDKILLLSIIFLLFYSFSPGANAQKVVLYTQGKLVGSLPYGQHFYISGSTKLPNGLADNVVVEIFDAGSYKKSRYNAALEEERIDEIISKSSNLVTRSEWYAFREADDKKDTFKAYIDAVLEFNRKYLVAFTFTKRFTFTLTAAEKDSILNKVVDGVIREFRQNEEISLESIQELLNDQTFRMLRHKAYAENEVFFSADDIRENLPNIVIEEPTLNVLREDVGQISSDVTIIAEANKTIKQREPELSGPDSLDVKEGIEYFKKEIARKEKNVQEVRKKLDEKLIVIKNQMVVVGKEYVISTPKATAATTNQR